MTDHSVDDSPSPVLLHREDGVGWLTLNRPGQANAIDIPLAAAFCEAVDAAIADEHCRVLVISGDSRFFSAGGDVRAMYAAGSPPDYLRELVDTLHTGVAALAASPLIVIAEVEGNAAGAGFALALGADLVFAAPSATFLTAYLGVGLTPDTGLSALLPRIVGPHRASELLYLGRKLDAATALDWGVVNEIVPAELLRARVTEVAQTIAGGPFPATAETKRLLRDDEPVDFPSHLGDEANTIVSAIASTAAQQRLAAFTARSATR